MLPLMPPATSVDLARLHVRWSVPGDLPAVLAIEEASFEYVWTADDFRRTSRRRDVVFLVAESWLNGPVAGYMVYELCPRRFDLLNFAVAPSCRRRGVGAKLVAHLVRKLSPHRRTKLVACVRERNLGAQLFFAACGFRATRVLRRFYEDSGEDGYRMEWRLHRDE